MIAFCFLFTFYSASYSILIYNWIFFLTIVPFNLEEPKKGSCCDLCEI